jgi:DNA-directed RNA polymerase specialized sigma24 family protein
MTTPGDASKPVDRTKDVIRKSGPEPHLSTEDLQILWARVVVSLRVRFAGQIAETDLEEIAQDAVYRFMDATRRGKVSASPGGYLTRIAINAAIDRLRRDHRMVLVDPADLVDVADTYSTEDEIAARLDGSPDAGCIRRALSTAHEAGDNTVVKVVTYLLEEIEQTGEVPSARAAGAALGLSHTGVAKALERFRRLLSPTDAPHNSAG